MLTPRHHERLLELRHGDGAVAVAVKVLEDFVHAKPLRPCAPLQLLKQHLQVRRVLGAVERQHRRGRVVRSGRPTRLHVDDRPRHYTVLAVAAREEGLGAVLGVLREGVQRLRATREGLVRVDVAHEGDVIDSPKPERVVALEEERRVGRLDLDAKARERLEHVLARDVVRYLDRVRPLPEVGKERFHEHAAHLDALAEVREQLLHGRLARRRLERHRPLLGLFVRGPERRVLFHAPRRLIPLVHVVHELAPHDVLRAVAHRPRVGLEEQIDLALGEPQADLVVREHELLDELRLRHGPVAVLIEVDEVIEQA